MQQKFYYFLWSLLEAKKNSFYSFKIKVILFIIHRENTIIDVVFHAFLYIYVFIGHICYYLRPYTISLAMTQCAQMRKKLCQFYILQYIFTKLHHQIGKFLCNKCYQGSGIDKSSASWDKTVYWIIHTHKKVGTHTHLHKHTFEQKYT